MTRITEAAAKVYAHALFEVGSEQECLGEIYDDLHIVLKAFAGQDDIRAVFAPLPPMPMVTRKARFTDSFSTALNSRIRWMQGVNPQQIIGLGEVSIK